MKRSDIEKHIEEIIMELLDEGTLKVPTTDGTSKTATSTQKDQAKKALQSGDSVEFQKSTEAP
jgi:hypothetical protein